MKHRAIVVGTAGGGSGTNAVAWAAREARLRRRPLRIVHVLEWNPAEARESAGSTYVERVWASSTATTDAAIRHVRDLAPEVDVTADTLVGHPAARLLEIAHDAELLVLGYRGRGGFAGLRLGSAGQRVATHASGPVAVVRGHPSPDGPVVAGVDGSAAADHVLDSAFTAAGVRAARLIVVRSVAADRDAADGDLLHEQLAPWRDKFPDVAVETLLTHDDIAPTLVSASAGAQLVMVGSRGRGAIRGALLGSTGLHLLQHAECPVLLARPCAGDRWAG
jgi:nucleotide-binding universal stress UspA family protein